MAALEAGMEAVRRELEECRVRCGSSFDIREDPENPRVWHVAVGQFDVDGSIEGSAVSDEEDRKGHARVLTATIRSSPKI